MVQTTFTGATLEAALKEDLLTQSGTELIGMVKSSEKTGHVCFTRSGCDKWVDLPIDMIEEAEKKGQNTCNDHSHPVMKITIKEPKNPESKILLALLSDFNPQNIQPEEDSYPPEGSSYLPEGSSYPPEGSSYPPEEDSYPPEEDSYPSHETSLSFRRDFGPNAPAHPIFHDNNFWKKKCRRTTCKRCLARKWFYNGTIRYLGCISWQYYSCTKCKRIWWPWE